MFVEKDGAMRVWKQKDSGLSVACCVACLTKSYGQCIVVRVRIVSRTIHTVFYGYFNNLTLPLF